MHVKQINAHPNNYERTRQDTKIDLILLHWSGGQTLAQTDSEFLNSNRLASVHYAIEAHEIHQYVKDEHVAFHAGTAQVDKRSIGIICVGGINAPFSDATYQTVILLVEELCRKYRIPIDRDHIKRHRDVATGSCPGDLLIDRIITETKKLSPQSMLDRLRSEVSELKEKNELLEKRDASHDEVLDELRNTIEQQNIMLVEKGADIATAMIHINTLEESLQAADHSNSELLKQLHTYNHPLIQYARNFVINIQRDWHRLTGKKGQNL